MERYKLIKEVGVGTFGCVWRAANKQTGEVVAIKKMKKKYDSWEECINLREVKSLRKMSHPNIVKLKEVIKEHDILHFVFEHMDCNLYELMKDRGRPFSEDEVRNWCFQVFQALAYIHQRGYFHRDLKPENLLVSKEVIKVADFGLAREINSGPPYTEYVSTRWYRAPEVLLRSPIYTSAVDMWAMGAIMAELFTLRPLFPGLSEADEIYKICRVVGTPTEHSWAYGLLLGRAMNYQFPQLPGMDLSTLIPSASYDAIALIRSLCSWNPFQRPTAAEVLQHPFFQNCFYVSPSLRTRATMNRTPPSMETKRYIEQKAARKSSGPEILPFSKGTNLNTYETFGVGVQRKLEMDGKDINKNANLLKSSVNQPKYRPPAWNSTSSVYSGSTTDGVMEATEKLSNMSLGYGRQAIRQSLPAPIKAGGWHGQSNMFMGQSQSTQHSRSFNRKVAG